MVEGWKLFLLESEEDVEILVDTVLSERELFSKAVMFKKVDHY